MRPLLFLRLHAEADFSHPNIGQCTHRGTERRGSEADILDKLGRICLDILKDKWSPALQIRTVLYVTILLDHCEVNKRS